MIRNSLSFTDPMKDLPSVGPARNKLLDLVASRNRTATSAGTNGVSITNRSNGTGMRTTPFSLSPGLDRRVAEMLLRAL
jgi:hypothetical protein